MTRLLCVLTVPVMSTKIRRHLAPAGAGIAQGQGKGRPYFFVIEAAPDNPDTGALLYRLDGRGDSVGDTWHRSIEEAQLQAACEHEGLMHEWEEIPADVDIDLQPISMN